MITEKRLSAIMPGATAVAIALWLAPLRAAMEKFDVSTAPRMAGFLASVANETGQLSAMTEASYFRTPYSRIRTIFGFAAPSPDKVAHWRTLGQDRFDMEFFNWVYDDANRGRFLLGNKHPGDGFKYRGRGPGQITGKHNYQEVFRKMGLPADTDPDVLLDPTQGSEAFAKYWKDIGNNERLDSGNFIGAMRAMNSGLTDFTPHLVYFSRAIAVLHDDPRLFSGATVEAAKLATRSKTGAAAATAAGAVGITVADAASRIGEAQIAATAARGLFATLGLPTPWIELALGLLAILAILYVVLRYFRKLARGEAVST